MRRFAAILSLSFLTNLALADCKSGQPWYMAKAPNDPSKESTVHVQLSAPAASLVRVCYCDGDADTHIWGRTNTDSGSTAVTQIWKGACADLGGRNIWIANPNGRSVTGVYERL